MSNFSQKTKRSFYTRVVICLLASALLLPTWISAEVAYEKPPRRKTSELAIPKEILQGKNHKLGPYVENDGYMNIYDLRTEFGDIKVRGTYFLIKRISEIDAIDYLKTNYPTTSVAGKAAVNTAKGIVIGPIKGAQKLYETVSDREKLEKTARAIPGGVVNLFSAAATAIGDVATYSYKTGKSVVTGETEESKMQFDKAYAFVEKHALDYVGYNDAFRNTAKVVQVDPYTENHLLYDELRRVATVEASAKVGSKFVPGLYSIPGVGTANKYLGYAQKTATYDDPEEVDKLNAKVLTALGEGDDVGEEHKLNVAALMSNVSYSPPMRRAIVDALKQLENVPYVEDLIVSSSKAPSRETAMFFVRAIEHLGKASRSGKKFAAFVPGAKIPAARLNSGGMIIPLPVDYIVWTKEVATILGYFEKEAKAHKASTTLLVEGRVSPKATKELKALGIDTIAERTQFLAGS